jgi:Right handed beta helix region
LRDLNLLAGSYAAQQVQFDTHRLRGGISDMKHFRRIALLLLLPSLLFFASGCSEEDDNGPSGPDYGKTHTGTIAGDFSGVFTISGTVTVPADDILILQPGTEVYFENGAALNVEGEIQAIGTETDWITFTSVNSSADRGQWEGIRLLEASDNSAFEYVNVAYATKYVLRTDTTRFYFEDGDVARSVPDSLVYRGAITIKNCSPTISHSIIEQGGYSGIHVIGNSAPIIEYNTIVQNAFNAIHIEPDWSIVNQDSGAVDRLDELYANLGQSVIRNNILVENDDAGIRLPQDQLLYEGGLVPEVMYNDIWNNASLAYVPPDWVSPTTPNFADVSTNIQVNPIFVDLEASDYDLHPCSGVIDRADPADKDADGTRADMGATPLYQGPYDLSKRLKHDEVYNKLELEAGEVYLVRCDVWVDEGDVLTVGEGTIFAFEGPYSLYIYGGAEISGSQGKEVVFTSAMDNPQRADWRQIVFEEATNESFMEHTIIEYASMDNRSSPSPDTLGALTVIACAPSFSNITIRESYYAGLHCFNGANPEFDGLVIDDVGFHGVVCMLNSSPTISHAAVSNCKGYGFYLIDNSNPEIENLLMYNLNGSGFYISDLSSPVINFATVYGKRLEDIGNEDPSVRRASYGIHAVNYAKPRVSNSIFANYKENGVLSQVSSLPHLRYTYFFSDVSDTEFEGNVETVSVYLEELTFENASEFNFTLPAGSPGLTSSEGGGEVGAYGTEGN